MKKCISSMFSPKDADASRSSGSVFASRAASVAMAAVISLVLCFPGRACSSGSSDSQSGNGAQNQAAQQVDDTCDEFGFVVSVEEWSGGSINVRITGQSDSGKSVDETLVVKPDVQKTVSFGSGTYNLAVDTNAMASATVVYQACEQTYTFEGKKDSVARLVVKKDAEASDALVAKAKAEQEAKATAEKAAAEQAAAEKAAAEQAAAEQAAAEQQAVEEEATASQNNTATVYITKTGECYHRDGCSSLRKSKIPILVSDAQAGGIDPAKTAIRKTSGPGVILLARCISKFEIRRCKAFTPSGERNYDRNLFANRYVGKPKSVLARIDELCSGIT